MAQDLAGRGWRVLGHRGAPVYRALASLDERLVTRLNALVRRSERFEGIVARVAERLATVEVGVMLLLAVSGRRHSALRMLVAVGTIYVAVEGMGRLWPRHRPFEDLPAVRALAPHRAGRSFPSRHVASGLAMAAIGGREHRRLGRFMAAVAWLLGLGRVAAGLHYPSDVLVGAGLGRLVGAWLAQSARRTRS